MENNENDYLYESHDGFSTKIWGPPVWFFLHMITFNYPVNPTKKDKINYRNFFQSLGFVLPCRVCRENYQIKNSKIPLKYFKSRHSLARYIYKVHQDVPNQKPFVSFSKMRKNYETFRAKCGIHGCQKPSKKNVALKSILNIVPQEKFATEPSFKIIS